MNFFHKYKEYRPSRALFTFQIFLLFLIILGIGFILTRDLWVPSVVTYLLKREDMIQTNDMSVINEISEPEQEEDEIIVDPENVESFEWKTYSNPELGVSFKYPTFGLGTDIRVVRYPEYSGYTEIEFLFSGTFLDRVIDKDSWGYGVYIYDNNKKLSLEEWARERVNYCEYYRVSTSTLGNGLMWASIDIDWNNTSIVDCDPIGVSHFVMPPSKRFIFTASDGQDELFPEVMSQHIGEIMSSVLDIN